MSNKEIQAETSRGSYRYSEWHSASYSLEDIQSKESLWRKERGGGGGGQKTAHLDTALKTSILLQQI